MDSKQPIDDILTTHTQRARYELDYMSIVLFLFAILGVVLLFSLLTSPLLKSAENISTEVIPEEIVEETKEDPFNALSLESKAIYVYDVRQQKALYSHNSETQLPLASITKLMTILAAEPYIEADDTITISYDSLEEEGDSGLFAFEEWGAKDLFDFTLLVSSNDAADALAYVAGGAKAVRSGTQNDTPETVFLDEMNTKAREIGLTQTYFVNETGLDPTTHISGGYGSARDAAKLLEYMILETPELVEATAYPRLELRSKSNFDHTATNTNEIVGSIPGLIASKTGFTDLAGGNLVIAFDAGIDRPIIVSVLGASREGRFTDVEKLVAASLDSLK